MGQLRALAALAVLPLLVTTACGDDDDDAVSDTTEEAASSDTTEEADDDDAEVQQVTFVAEDYVFADAPEISAGAVELTLHNKGKVAHEVAFIEIGDAAIEDFPADFAPVFEGGPFPEYADAGMVPLEVEGGKDGTATFVIEAGTYALFCALDGDADAPAPAEGEEPAAGEPHFNRGMIQSFTVGEGDDDAELPDADGSITARDYTFEFDVEDGDRTVNFVNEGPDQLHFAAVSVFPEGTTVAQAEEAFGTLLTLEEGAPPPEGTVLPEDFGFSGIASAGLGVQFEPASQFESGRTYVAVCFISDRAGGPPHAIGNKMYKAFTVE